MENPAKDMAQLHCGMYDQGYCKSDERPCDCDCACYDRCKSLYGEDATRSVSVEIPVPSGPDVDGYFPLREVLVHTGYGNKRELADQILADLGMFRRSTSPGTGGVYVLLDEDVDALRRKYVGENGS